MTDRAFSRTARTSGLSLVATLFAVSCGEIPSAPKISSEALLASAQSTQGLVVTPTNSTILIGQSLTLTVKNSNGSAINKTASWTSTDPAIASVVSTGTGTARVTGLRSGTVTITAVSSNKSGSAGVTVVPVPVHSVTLTPDSARVELGESVQYTATARDSAGTVLPGRAISWDVSDVGIASISNTGLAESRGRGATRVIATVEGVADTTWLVVQQTPTRLEVFEKSILFDALGETKQLVASVYDSRNHLITDAVVTWSSSDTEIATVDAGGVVTPRSTAQSAWTFVSASLGALADTATVTVYRYPTSIVASPDTMFITELAEPGEISGQFTAVMNDRNGYPVNGGWVMWEVLGTAGVVSVAMDGSVVAHANGEASVVAISFSGVTDTVHVVVNAPAAEPQLVAHESDSGIPFESHPPRWWLASTESRRRGIGSVKD